MKEKVLESRFIKEPRCARCGRGVDDPFHFAWGGAIPVRRDPGDAFLTTRKSHAFVPEKHADT